MNIPDLSGGKFEAAAESVTVRVLIRLFLLPLMAASVAALGWYISRQADTLERVERLAIEAKQDGALLGQSIELRAQARSSQIVGMERRGDDHEVRIRSLEARR